MKRRFQIILIALAALVAVSHREAASQDPTPTVPTKQTPPLSAVLDANVPSSAFSDSSFARTSRIAVGETGTATSPLSELAWLVGDWADDDGDGRFEASVKWSKNGAFLIHSYRVSNVAAEPISGMQIVAWDPAEKRIRSWTYDSHGGFGEESWSRAGDRWSIRKKFTLPDGGRASALQIITRASDDAFRFKSVNRVIDGALQPDLDEVTLVRKSAEPVATAPDAAATQNASTPTGDQ